MRCKYTTFFCTANVSEINRYKNDEALQYISH